MYSKIHWQSFGIQNSPKAICNVHVHTTHVHVYMYVHEHVNVLELEVLMCVNIDTCKITHIHACSNPSLLLKLYMYMCASAGTWMP